MPPRLFQLGLFFSSALLGTLAPASEATAPVAVSEWVHAGPDGRLVYKTDASGNRIPDFSRVGYRTGTVPLPDVPVRTTVAPADGDAGARIQAAIDAVSKLPADAEGRRGAVLLKKGRYPIAGTLKLHTGGVVLRGEGASNEGTVLVATGAKQRSLIVVGASAATPARDDDEDVPDKSENKSSPLSGPHRVIVDEYVPVGACRFHVDDASDLKVGSEIIIKRPSTAAWIHDIAMDRIPSGGKKIVQWAPGSKDLFFHRTITAVTGNEITIDAPIVNALEKKYGGGEVFVVGGDSTIREVGVENLLGDSEFTSATDENHGWVLVELAAVRDSWVRHVTAIHYGYSCVNVRKATRSVTIENCAYLQPVSLVTGGRRYAFALDGELTLVQHCYARNGRHDFVMHALAAGPNVFFDCRSDEATADSGPHHRWSVGVLYDNVHVTGPSSGPKKGQGAINIRDRGNSGSGHGWAGANQVVWNSSAAEMVIQQPPTAQNWAIGCVTPVKAGNAYWDSFGHPVQPRSLYLAQLQERIAAEKPAAAAGAPRGTE